MLNTCVYLYCIFRQTFIEDSRNIFEHYKEQKIVISDGFFKDKDVSFVCLDSQQSKGYFGTVAGILSSGAFQPFSRFCVLEIKDREIISSGDSYKFDSFKNETF